MAKKPAKRRSIRPQSNQQGIGSSKPTTMRFHSSLLARVDKMAASAKYQRTRSWLVAHYLEQGLGADGDKAADLGVLS